MKTIEEMVKVMQHYANGGEVESKSTVSTSGKWNPISNPIWNWDTTDYRIKEPKKTITIEKWVIGKYNELNNYWILEGTKEHFENIDWNIYNKVKLLKTYEEEL